MTYQMLEQFLWGHMECHSVNNLEIQEKHIKFNLPYNYTVNLLKLFESAFSHTTEKHIYININNFSLPEQHSVWDCHCLCRLRCHLPRPLGPVHQVGELQSAQGKWPAGWGSAASASAPSTKKRKL